MGQAGLELIRDPPASARATARLVFWFLSRVALASLEIAVWLR